MSLATYNNYDFLEKVSIPSVLAQTFTDWTLYITSDGLNNNRAKEIVESFNDGRLIYHEVERVLAEPPFTIGSGHWNIAGYQAVNFGLEQIKKHNNECKYIAHIDDDDFWLPNHLEHLYNQLEDNKFRADLIYGNTKYYAANRYISNLSHIPFNRQGLLNANYIAHSSILYKADCTHDYYYSGQMHEPSDYQHLKSFAGNMTHSPEETVLYFQKCSVDFAIEIVKMYK